MKYIAAAIVMLAAVACTNSQIQVVKPDDVTGEVVSVSLNLDVEQTMSPATDHTTKAATSEERVVASERTNGMLVELLEEPDTEPIGKAVDESAIKNFWVFQYNGEATTSKLILKQYYPTYTAGQKVDMISGVNQRVVVVANTFDATMGDAQTVGTSTYQSITNKGMSVTIDQNSLFTNSGANMILSCSQVSAIGSGVLKLKLSRNVASISFGVKLGVVGVFMADRWTAQLIGVPNFSYFLPNMEAGAAIKFPATVTTINYEAKPTTFNSNNFTNFQWFVPVNRRGVVANTTTYKRVTNAPAGATAVRITGSNDMMKIVYTIPLGADFMTDYNIRANYKYTYRVTLYDDPDGIDSQVRGGFILINGLKWATGNLVADASVTPGSGVATGTNGTKVKIGEPTDGGLYFQFGSLIGYKGGNTASKGTGRGIPNWTTAISGNDSYWNGGASYSWANDAMVWPQAHTNGATTWPRYLTGNSYYFGLQTYPYYSRGQKLSAYNKWESGGLVNTDVAVGDPCRYYLGGGWRMPTAEDWGKLFNSVYANGPVGGTWPGVEKDWVYGTATKTVMAGIPSSSNSATEGVGIYANTTATTEAAAKADPKALFFPASGARYHSTGSFTNVGRNGYSWSGSVYIDTNGFNLYFTTTSVGPQYNHSRSRGFPVRCVSAP